MFYLHVSCLILGLGIFLLTFYYWFIVWFPCAGRTKHDFSSAKFTKVCYGSGCCILRMFHRHLRRMHILLFLGSIPQMFIQSYWFMVFSSAVNSYLLSRSSTNCWKCSKFPKYNWKFVYFSFQLNQFWFVYYEVLLFGRVTFWITVSSAGILLFFSHDFLCSWDCFIWYQWSQYCFCFH